MEILKCLLVVVLLTTAIRCGESRPKDENNKKQGKEIADDHLKRGISENDGPAKRSTSTLGGDCNKGDCKELYDAGHTKSGVYCIDPDGQGAFLVYCDMVTSGGGWTVFQRRLDGTVDFYRDWVDYKEGFGNKKTEYWLGLENLRRMTSQKSYKLRVDLMDENGNWKYAEYSYFAVNTETLKYKLNLGKYSGTAGDSLTHHGNMMFTTRDQDNDTWSGNINCAVSSTGAWWYYHCQDANLNGKYLNPGTSSWHGVVWKGFKGTLSLKRAEMKIRPL